MEVHAEEVFTAPEAALLFAEFLRHGDITGEVHRRPIVLDDFDADDFDADDTVLTEEDGRRLLELAEAGNVLADADDFAGALVPWREALAMLPEPVEQWDDGLWFLGSVGDACVATGAYAEAERLLRRCFSYEEGRDSALIWLRLGQAQFEQGYLDDAMESLRAAYLLDGEEIFEDEDPKYRRLLIDRDVHLPGILADECSTGPAAFQTLTQVIGGTGRVHEHFANMLATCAFTVAKNAWLAAPGVVFPDAVRTYFPRTTTPHLMWTEPFLAEALSSVEVEGAGTLHWLLGVPISDAEATLLHRHGREALEHRLAEAPIFDLTRESTAS